MKLQTAFLLALAVATASPALAQTAYPTKPIRLIGGPALIDVLGGQMLIVLESYFHLSRITRNLPLIPPRASAVKGADITEADCLRVSQRGLIASLSGEKIMRSYSRKERCIAL